MIVDILEGFVEEFVGPEATGAYRLTTTDVGVSFVSPYVPNLKFSLIISPMFGVSKGYVGLVTSYAGMPCRDKAFKFEDPECFDKLSRRIDEWLVHFKTNRPLPTDWYPNRIYFEYD